MSRDVRAIFGEKVRGLRRMKNMTQEELADKSRLHPTYIGQIERGRRNPSLINIYKIVKALQVSASKVFPD